MKKSFQGIGSVSLLLLIFLTSCKDSSGQKTETTDLDSSDVLSALEKLSSKPRSEVAMDEENRMLFLAMSKICMASEDYASVFGKYRTRGSLSDSHGTSYKNGAERITTKNCCTEIIPAPFVSPLEYYEYHYEGNQEILENKNNLFKLEKIRTAYKKKEDAFIKTISEIDTENMVLRNFIGFSINHYSFDKQKLHWSGYSDRMKTFETYGPSRVEILPIEGHTKDRDFFFSMDMSPERAEELFDYYDSISESETTTSRPLNTKITYSLARTKKGQSSPYAFSGTIKKIEFFIPNKGGSGWTNKLTEFNF